MMAPAATAAASGAKAGAIDAASLFAADKAAATEAQVALAATAKKDGVASLAGLSDAVVKVSIRMVSVHRTLGRWLVFLD